jgi:hypothetical protein
MSSNSILMLNALISVGSPTREKGGSGSVQIITDSDLEGPKNNRFYGYGSGCYFPYFFWFLII